MNCSHCQPLLSASIDDTMRVDERAAVEGHLRDCMACRALLEDLVAVRAVAQSLEPLTPPGQVWHRLAAAVVAEPRRGGFQVGWFGWRPLTALAMAAVIATGLWRVAALLEPAAVPRSTSQSAAAAPGDVNADAEADYTVAIARLEEVTAVDRGALDSETAGAFSAGLTVIDQAITESRAALQSEPESEPAHESLFEALRRKVALLQEMLALINEMRKGNQEGAARVLSEINR